MLEGDCIVHAASSRAHGRCEWRGGIDRWAYVARPIRTRRPFEHVPDDELQRRAARWVDHVFRVVETSAGILAPRVPYLRHTSRMQAAKVEVDRAATKLDEATEQLARALDAVQAARADVDFWASAVDVLAVEAARARPAYEALVYPRATDDVDDDVDDDVERCAVHADDPCDAAVAAPRAARRVRALDAVRQRRRGRARSRFVGRGQTADRVHHGADDST